MASDDSDTLSVLAGDCTVRFERGTDDRRDDSPADFREDRGNVLLVEKPDGTVIVHDRDGYRPVAWLTRADAVSWSPDGPTVRAVSDDQRLVVTCHDEHGHGRYPTSRAGAPVGGCPNCSGTLIRAPEAVTCLECSLSHSIPRDATVLDVECDTCTLPRISVERGEAFELCVDRSCDSLDAAVRDRFDRQFDCPDCSGELLVLRRGGLLLGCENYPDCENGFSFPAGTFGGTCECGLPLVETEEAHRCLDTTCAIAPTVDGSA